MDPVTGSRNIRVDFGAEPPGSQDDFDLNYEGLPDRDWKDEEERRELLARFEPDVRALRAQFPDIVGPDGVVRVWARREFDGLTRAAAMGWGLTESDYATVPTHVLRRARDAMEENIKRNAAMAARYIAYRDGLQDILDAIAVAIAEEEAAETS